MTAAARNQYGVAGGEFGNEWFRRFRARFAESPPADA